MKKEKINRFVAFRVLLFCFVMFYPLSTVDVAALKTYETDIVESKYLLPHPYSLDSTLPYMYFIVPNHERESNNQYVYVRHVENCELVRIVETRTNEMVVLCQDEYVLFYDFKTNPDKYCFRRVSVDGSEKLFELDVSLVDPQLQCNKLGLVGGEPVMIFETQSTYLHREDYQIAVLTKDGILWSETINKDDSVNVYAQPDTIKKGVIVISIASKRSGESVGIVSIKDIYTGDIRYEFNSYGTQVFVSDDSNVFIFYEYVSSTENKYIVVNAKEERITYEFTTKTHINAKEVNNQIWITSLKEAQGIYEFSKTDLFILTKLDSDGELIESVKFEPYCPELLTQQATILDENIFMVRENWHIFLLDWRTGNKLFKRFTRYPKVYNYEDKILCLDKGGLYCIEKGSFNILWQLDVALYSDLETTESETQYFIHHLTIDYDNECEAIRIRAINKANLSEEPFDYFISPMKYGVKDIFHTPYGLLCRCESDRIKCISVGNVVRYDRKLTFDISTLKPTDDPRYYTFEMISKSEYVSKFIFDAKYGTYKIVSED